MFGHLSEDAIEDVLHKQFIGRIGCNYNDLTYVVPIGYAYDGKYVYAHAEEGMKINMMRQNPKVCFEVYRMENMGNWQCVIGWGNFEEIDDEMERKKALHILSARRLPISSSITTHLGHTWPFMDEDAKGITGLFFRISLKEKSGEYESSSVSPQPILGYVLGEGIV